MVNAISIWEPWASFMRADMKRIETRSWPMPDNVKGKPLLICAAKCWTKEQMAIYDKLADMFPQSMPPRMHQGMAVALVRAIESKPTEDITFDESFIMEEELGDYSPSRWGWITEPIDLQFTPFSVRGSQGIYKVAVKQSLSMLKKVKPF